MRYIAYVGDRLQSLIGLASIGEIQSRMDFESRIIRNMCRLPREWSIAQTDNTGKCMFRRIPQAFTHQGPAGLDRQGMIINRGETCTHYARGPKNESHFLGVGNRGHGNSAWTLAETAEYEEVD